MLLSALQSNTDAYTNSADPDETGHKEPSLQDLYYLLFCS